jgi:hypothetical protein
MRLTSRTIIDQSLRKSGWRYAGVCNCSTRWRKYKRGSWLMKIHPEGWFNLYFQNQIQYKHESLDNLDKVIQEAGI